MTVRSLRIDLLKSLLLPITGSALVSGVIAILFIYHEIQEVYDATLVQYAHTIARTVPDVATFENIPAGAVHKYERKIVYRILQADNVIAQTADAPALQGLPPGFMDINVKGHPWRYFVMIDERTGQTIEVGETYSIRYELALQLLASLIVPGILFIVLMMVVLWRGTTRGLGRLSLVSRTVDDRAADDLSAIERAEIPVEVSPLIEALNRLFVRIEDGFNRERQFTDNAAHELRTPLAAIKTQAQVIARTEKLSNEGRLHLDNLLAAVDRASAMTSSLLAFARLQNERTAPVMVDLAAITLTEIEALKSFAEQRNVHVVSHLQDVSIKGVPEGLATLVRNLVQNAIKFSPEGGAVDVNLKNSASVIELSVGDNGPGIAPHHRDRVFERFYRINKSHHDGIGLGLAMVKWVVDQHSAQIVLADNNPHGLKVTVFFKKA